MAVTVKKKTIGKIAIFSAIVLFLILLLAGVFNKNDAPIISIPINQDDPILGNQSAIVSVVEFSDFECPFCGDAARGVLQDLKASTLFTEGQANLIFKQFPLTTSHEFAQKAAEASECANDQGAFWEYHDILFASQENLDVLDLKQYATNLGLDTTTFNACLDNDEKRSSISTDLNQGVQLGVEGTPTFIVFNHETQKAVIIPGIISWDQMKSIIETVRDTP